MKPIPFKLITLFTISLLSPIKTYAECTCESTSNPHKTHSALIFKLSAIASILFSSSIGICIPILLKNHSSLQPNKPIHFLIKSLAAGIILSTGFIHILPDAFESLTSPCLGKNYWGDFPFAGFIAMGSAIGTLMMESFATGYHRRAELRKAQPFNGDEEGRSDNGDLIVLERASSSDLVRNRVISQVLELGIVVHSVIIGISLGATRNTKTIRSLIAALSFHQFFEGMGLGGCISEAKYKLRTVIIMILFFSLTTPTGIAIGMVISKTYNENSPTALAVEGVLNAASAGILIYMALVDLLAVDFNNPVLQSNFKLQLGTNFALIIGACCMTLLAKVGGI